jgi:hypothetical protein
MQRRASSSWRAVSASCECLSTPCSQFLPKALALAVVALPRGAQTLFVRYHRTAARSGPVVFSRQHSNSGPRPSDELAQCRTSEMTTAHSPSPRHTHLQVVLSSQMTRTTRVISAVRSPAALSSKRKRSAAYAHLPHSPQHVTVVVHTLAEARLLARILHTQCIAG